MYALSKMMGIEKTDDLEFILNVIPMLDQIYLNKVYADKEKAAKAQQKKKPPSARGRNG
jgi:hypothetical protein